MGSGRVVERQHGQSGSHAFNLPSVLHRARGFLGTIQQLGQDDGGDAQSPSLVIEADTQSCRPVTQNTNAQIRIQHETEHQSVSRA